VRCTSYTIAALLCILLHLKPFSNRNVPHFLSSPSFESTAVPEAVGQSPLTSAHQLLLHPDFVVFACDDLVPTANGGLSVRSGVTAAFHAGTDMLNGRAGPPDVLFTYIYIYGTHPPDVLVIPENAPNCMEASVVSAHKRGWNFSFGKTQQLGVVDYSFNSSIA